MKPEDHEGITRKQSEGGKIRALGTVLQAVHLPDGK